MGFQVATEAGLPTLNEHLKTRSYIDGHSPSQADVAVSKAITYSVDASKFPYVARWAKHVKSFAEEFPTLPGDASKAATAYGPDAQLTINSKTPAAEEEDDDDVDLFGSDDEEEDAEAARVREERLASYAAKKAGKTKPAAKSICTLDVKPWDDETDMAELEKAVRAISKDGLVWGGSKLVAVGYGVKKLQINLVIEDEKISLSELQEQIEEIEDFVQSTDVQAMQKL